MEFDAILQEVGEFGRYQKALLYLVLLPAVFPCGFHAYNQIFMAKGVGHFCRVPELLRRYDQDTSRNLSIPFTTARDGTTGFSQCSMYDHNYSDWSSLPQSSNSNGAEIVPCKHGWLYSMSNSETSVISEWDLVCEHDLAATMALVLFAVGGLVGNYIFGFIQDGLGRKPAFFIYLLIECVFGVATAFAGSFLTWTLFRIGVGFTVPAILGTPYVLAIEIVGPAHRTLVAILLNIAYSLALVSLALIVWAVREWRLLALVTTVPFFGLFFHLCLMPESPRWLLAEGYTQRAEEVLSKMARVNGRRWSSSYIAKVKEDAAKRANGYGIRHLFGQPNLRRKTAIVTFIWFTTTSVYVGLSYYAPALGGDEFLNFFLASLVELPTYVVLWPALHRIGRRWILCCSMVVGGVACLMTCFFQDSAVVMLALYCVGKMGISSSFVVLPLMASELYPTVVRGLGISFSSVVGMLGPVFIPLINYLGYEMTALPLFVMGVMQVLGAVGSLLLPETLNLPLPQTLRDAEETGMSCLA